MHRTIIEFGELGIRSYGLALVVAFWLGIELSARLAKKRGLDPVRILDLGLVVLVSSLVGSRLLYVLTHWAEYEHDRMGILRIWEGGLTFYGGLVCGLVFGMLYLRRKGLPVLTVSDLVAPQIALGIAIARVGCFFNGCCFGKESNLPWAVVFPADCQAGWVMPGKHLYPTQIYSALANLVLFVVLRRLLKRGLARGVVFSAFLVSYGSWRFAIDYLRYYEPSAYLGRVGITSNQAISLVMIIVGLVLGTRQVRNEKGRGVV
jgi:phosphatidylglycerol:prolipoprotein diacylglycerol transferase